MLNIAKYLKLHCQKVEPTRNGKLRRLSVLSGRFQTVPGSQIVGKTRKWERGGKKGKTYYVWAACDSTAVARLDFLAIDVKLVSIVLT